MSNGNPRWHLENAFLCTAINLKHKDPTTITSVNKLKKLTMDFLSID